MSRQPRCKPLIPPPNARFQGTASNIKSRVNRLSVLSAITSTQQRLKLYNKVPPNGLVVYCGEIITSEGKERKINIDFEPFKPINTSLYLCDNKFHTEALSELLESDQKFGFIIMDGNGALFGTLSGNTREILQRLSVDLPKKHVSNCHISTRPWYLFADSLIFLSFRAVVVSPLCVSRVCVRKSVTTTSVKSPNWLCRTILPMTRLTLLELCWLVPPISRTT